MSATLEAKIDELIAKTKDLRTFEELEAPCEEFITWLKQQNEIANNSLGSYFSKYRLFARLKEIPLEQGRNAVLVDKRDENGNVKSQILQHYVHRKCSEFVDWEKRNQTTRVIDRVEHSTEIDPDRYLQTTAKLLVSTDPHELAVGLIAATGRRPHEILARAKFTPIKDKTHAVSFEGQGKKRGEKPVFDIPTLFPGKVIVKALARLRNEPDTKKMLEEISLEFSSSLTRQNVEIDKRRNQSLNRIVRLYFGDAGNDNPVLAFRHNESSDNNKALRAAYAVLATERDCRGSTGAKILFSSRLLGHFSKKKEDDRNLTKIATSLGYLDYFVTKPVPFGEIPEEKVVNLKIYESDLDVAKQLQAQWNLGQQQEVTRKLIKAGSHLKFLESELFEAQKRIRELEQQTKQQPSSEELSEKIKALAEENFNLKNKLIDMELPKPTEPIEKLDIQSETTSTDSRIDKLEAIVMQLVKKLNQQPDEKEVVPTETVSIVPTTETAESPKKLTTAIKSIDWEGISNKELKSLKIHGAVEEKIKRAYQAIADYNDSQPENKDKYFVGAVSLKEVSGCNGQAVAAWVEYYSPMIDAHNSKHGLGRYHNKGKVAVEKKINIWG